jgi:hypothetical protein
MGLRIILIFGLKNKNEMNEQMKARHTRTKGAAIAKVTVMTSSTRTV